MTDCPASFCMWISDGAWCNLIVGIASMALLFVPRLHLLLRIVRVVLAFVHVARLALFHLRLRGRFHHDVLRVNLAHLAADPVAHLIDKGGVRLSVEVFVVYVVARKLVNRLSSHVVDREHIHRAVMVTIQPVDREESSLLAIHLRPTHHVRLRLCYVARPQLTRRHLHRSRITTRHEEQTHGQHEHSDEHPLQHLSSRRPYQRHASSLTTAANSFTPSFTIYVNSSASPRSNFCTKASGCIPGNATSVSTMPIGSLNWKTPPRHPSTSIA